MTVWEWLSESRPLPTWHLVLMWVAILACLGFDLLGIKDGLGVVVAAVQH